MNMTSLARLQSSVRKWHHEITMFAAMTARCEQKPRTSKHTSVNSARFFLTHRDVNNDDRSRRVTSRDQ